MKVHVFPKDTTSLDLLSALAREIVGAARSISELLGTPATEFAAICESVREREARTTDLLFSLLTHIRTSFVSVLPREDIYELGILLQGSIERLVAAADLITGYSATRLSRRAAEQLEIVVRQSELSAQAMKNLHNLDKLEDYWLDMLRLSHRAENTHRQWLTEMNDPNRPATLIAHQNIAAEFIAASRSLTQLSLTVGKILVKES